MFVFVNKVQIITDAVGPWSKTIKTITNSSNCTFTLKLYAEMLFYKKK